MNQPLDLPLFRSCLTRLLTPCVCLLAGLTLFLAPLPVAADPTAPPAPATTQAAGTAANEKKLEAAQTALMQARAAAARDYQNRPEYLAAVKAVHDTFKDFNDKRNSVVAEVVKDPRIAASRKQANDTDIAITEACRPNSTATPDQIEALFRQKEGFTRDWQTIENDAMDRQNLAPLRKAWQEASAKLAGLMDRESDEIEKAETVKAAAAAVQSAQAELNAAGTHTAGDADPVDDYLRRYPRAGLNRGLRGLELQAGPAT